MAKQYVMGQFGQQINNVVQSKIINADGVYNLEQIDQR